METNEIFDESLVTLRLGMRSWLNGDPASWDTIASSLSTLVRVGGLTEDDVLQEIGFIQRELGFTDDEVMDLDSSVMSWFQKG